MVARFSEAEFETWLKPMAALESVTGRASYDEQAAAFILAGLQAQNLLAAASVSRVIREEATTNFFRSGKTEQVVERCSLQDIDWTADIDRVLFWYRGTIRRAMQTREGGAPVAYSIAYTGIRIEPSGLALLAQRARDAPPGNAANSDPVTPAPRQPPKIERRELESWVAEYGAAHPDAHFGEFLQAARQNFGTTRRVSERPVKAAIAKLGITKSRGNPAIRRK